MYWNVLEHLTSSAALDIFMGQSDLLAVALVKVGGQSKPNYVYLIRRLSLP
jgi:hypothetical protein